MCEKSDWQKPYLQKAEDDRLFFSNKKKWERESWVVKRLLETFNIKFEESELKTAEEPVDVLFRDARFQIKEIMDPGYQRDREIKQLNSDIENAEDIGDLLRPICFTTLTFTEVVSDVATKIENLALKYGPREKPEMDLLFYHNTLARAVPPTDFEEVDRLGFRSVSVVTNTYCAILASTSEAPFFLKNNLSVVKQNWQS